MLTDIVAKVGRKGAVTIRSFDGPSAKITVTNVKDY